MALRSVGGRYWQVHRGPDLSHPAHRLTTAVDDDLIRRNPCRIKNAGQETAEERPISTLDQVFAIAEKIQPRYLPMVLLAALAQLRFGELIALRSSSINLDVMELRVDRATTELEAGGQHDGDPKSRAGKRPISLPHSLRTDIRCTLSAARRPAQMGGCSSDHKAGSHDGGTSTGSGRRRSKLRRFRPKWISISTTCDLQEARGPPGPGRRSRS